MIGLVLVIIIYIIKQNNNTGWLAMHTQDTAKLIAIAMND